MIFLRWKETEKGLDGTLDSGETIESEELIEEWNDEEKFNQRKKINNSVYLDA